MSDWAKISGELRRPFTAAAIKMKPQSVTKDQSKGLVSFYIDARLAAERLNAAVGADGWTEEYVVIAANPAFGLPVECRLTVLGVTRADVGQIHPGEMDDKAWKSAYSDALKRAAVKFGVGAYLYNSPNIWAETKIGGNQRAQGFSPGGVKFARGEYEKWVRSVRGLYGDPLDHGDVERVEDAPAEPPKPARKGATPPAAEVPDTAREEALLKLVGEKGGDVAKTRAGLETARNQGKLDVWLPGAEDYWGKQPDSYANRIPDAAKKEAA